MYFKKVFFSYYLLTTVILFIFICLFSAVIAINSISELQSARNQLVSYFEKEVVIPAFTLKSLLEINDFDGYDILLKNEDVCENIKALGRQLKGKVVLVSEVLGIQMNENCEKTMTSDLSWYNKFRKSNDKIQFEMGDRTDPKIYIDFKVYNDNEFVGAISFGISYKDILDSLSEKIGGQRVELLISKNSGRDVLGSSVQEINEKILDNIESGKGNWHLNLSEFGISSNEFPNFFFLSGTIKWIEFISIDQIGVEFYFIYPFDYILSLVWSRYGFQISLIFFLNFILVSVFLYYFLGRLSSLKFKSNHDFLTNLMNRRGLYSYLRDMDVDNKLYICLMDLDDFKVFNDKNGHLAGDEALRYISGMIRQTPFVLQAFRLGGEEFLLFSKSRNAILEFKELKDSIYINEFSFCNKKYQISSSMGVVLCENAKDTNIDTYIALADEALYEAKRRGKNLLCVKKDESCDFDVY